MAETIYLRVPDELKRSVEQRAEEEGESVNEYLARVIEAAIAEDDPSQLSRVDLSVDATIAFLEEVARRVPPAVVTYGDIAAHQGHSWSFVVWKKIVSHLREVWRECRRQGLPALTSLVVRKSGRNPSSGFLRLERTEGKAAIENEAAHVSAKQAECRQWARNKLSPSPDPWAHLRGTWKGPDVENFQDYMRGPPDETAVAE